MYVAAAGLYHRRAGDDVRLRSLMRTAFVRGRAARRFDALRGSAPRRPRELRTLLRCLGHVVVRRCPAGMTMVAHSAGRLAEALRGDAPEPRSTSTEYDFLSGTSGTVGGLDRVRRRAADRLDDAMGFITRRDARMRRAARSSPERRRVLVLGVLRSEHRALAEAARAELESSRHDVEVRMAEPDGRGKFENLNLLLEHGPPGDRDWLILVDDDVELPRGFLDNLLFLAERFSLDLVQPAHRRDSHAAWAVTRRRTRSVARETRFVEIGPVTALASTTFGVLLPFPPLRMGWGLDAHWAALAQQHHWRCGVLDAVAIRHAAAPAASAYSREETIAEARRFLSDHDYLPAAELQRSLTRHRHW
jgi:hypothetical protein